MVDLATESSYVVGDGEEGFGRGLGKLREGNDDTLVFVRERKGGRARLHRRLLWIPSRLLLAAQQAVHSYLNPNTGAPTIHVAAKPTKFNPDSAKSRKDQFHL